MDLQLSASCLRFYCICFNDLGSTNFMIERFLAAPNEPDQPDPNLDPVRPIQEEAWVQIEFIKYTIGLIENLNRF